MPIGATEHVAAQVGRKAFHCPFCRVLAQQTWSRLQIVASRSTMMQAAIPTDVRRSTCGNCREHTYWLMDDQTQPSEARLLWPIGSPLAPAPHADMPDEPRADYEEARGILERSPRGAAALLRLAVQKLMVSLGRAGENINSDIAALVKDGLSPDVQKALDTVRVTGNNAVHPGEIDLNDNADIAVAIFGLMNYIVEQQITRPRELESIYQSLPESSREQIARRDAS
jgi:Domain of unknown function (DUF4145)